MLGVEIYGFYFGRDYGVEGRRVYELCEFCSEGGMLGFMRLKGKEWDLD